MTETKTGFTYPRLVLRVAFVGSQHIAEDDEILGMTLRAVYEQIAQALAEIAPNVREVQGESAPASVAQFYAPEEDNPARLPQIRLITGLCQGGDTLANHSLEAFSTESKLAKYVMTELAAVLPFDVPGYRQSREEKKFQKSFDRQAKRCSYIIALDSTYEEGDGLQKERRARAYRAQAALLLRQCDLLVAMTDPGTALNAGGTMETVRAAMEFDLPVIFIHAGALAEKKNNKPGDDQHAEEKEQQAILKQALKAQVTVIEPGDDSASVLAGLQKNRKSKEELPQTLPGETELTWQEKIRFWVRHLTADPDIDRQKVGNQDNYTVNLLAEFFADVSPKSPVMMEAEKRPLSGWQQVLVCWARCVALGDELAPEFMKVLALDMLFCQGESRNDKAGHHEAERELFPGIPLVRAARLKERQKTIGERIWNSLIGRCSPGPEYEVKSDEVIEPYGIWRARARELNYYYSGNYRGAFVLNYLLAPAAVFLAALGLLLLVYGGIWAQEAREHPVPKPIEIGLIVIALAKLGILVSIAVNAIMVNGRKWNDRAVDYRFLAERLRAMFYLPYAGSFQPPLAMPRREANEAMRQSGVDWLFNAIVRSVSPAELSLPTSTALTIDNETFPCKIIKPEPLLALRLVRDGWIKQQVIYHSKTSHRSERIHLFLESWVEVLNVVVILLVVIDLLIGLFIETSAIKLWTPPALIFFAAALPAAVASFNAVRVQSECHRLAIRSALVCEMLWGSSSEQKAKRSATDKKHFSGAHEPEPKKRPTWERMFPTADNLELPQPPENVARSRWTAANRLEKEIVEAEKMPEENPHSWTPEVLRFTESVADVFAQEVSEWSVLYAKELPEP